MGTILEVSFLLFETPMGVVADTIGRRTSIVIGMTGHGLATLVLGVSHGFLLAAAAQVMGGVFATFVSGADVAWLTDEIGEEDARSLYLRGDQIAHAAALVGIVVSVALATVDLALPILIAGVGFLAIALALWVVMPEEHFEKRARKDGEHLHHSLVATLKDGLRDARAHPVLLLILGTTALHGASTEGFDRLADFHILRDIGLPEIGHLSRLWWFAILDGVSLLIGISALAVVRRRLNLTGHVAVARILAVIDIALVVSVVVFALANRFWLAIVAALIVGALRSIRDPIGIAWINQGLDAKTRATINSMGSQSDAIGQAVGGPVLGALAGGFGAPFAIVVSGLLRLPSLLLYRRAIRKGTVGTLAPDEIEPVLHLEDETAG